MPTYEFTCKACQHHFEVFTSISKKGEIVCPQCGGGNLKEAFGAFFVGGNVSNPGAGTGGSCSSGSCSSCASTCKT